MIGTSAKSSVRHFITNKHLEMTDENIQCKYRCDKNNNCVNCSNKLINYNNKTKIARKVLTVIRNGDFEELLIILRSKPDLNVFVNGQTALHYCLIFGRDVSWCRQLIQNGANPNLSNQDGWQPLHLAAYNGLHESMTYLIKCNKNINSEVL